MLPPWKTGGLDLSPIIVLIAIQILEWFLDQSLRDLALT